ncbi:M23 family metallopeptidase [Fibrella forsythiae]|uniref:M23 family metallopeptidase n=1 Tax=Fibrella forsythiae TaxID=2817061 RepID=A0ABS3JAU0_9BACT|nr:M23 family metallopeptidase [Fibrella forsythiae]MBO0947107.1 M23 family metallopeptidase [Fibrella forsythiae]
MRRFIGFLIALLVGGLNIASSQVPLSENPEPTPYQYCQRFNTLYIQIREETILPDSARAAFSRIMLGLRERFRTNVDFPTDTTSEEGRDRTAMWFPLKGYSTSAIGGTHGEGYRGTGFDLFDYNVRGSHPAQDIFIRDQNQDSVDDRNGKPVDVLSMSDGLVIAVETGWTPAQEYRGGNWIWVYDPVRNGLFYYAHNNVVNVAMGDWVRAGQKISEVGRTGLNAYKARSPTHLHLMYLQLQPTGLPLPQNTYAWLLTAKR